MIPTRPIPTRPIARRAAALFALPLLALPLLAPALAAQPAAPAAPAQPVAPLTLGQAARLAAAQSAPALAARYRAEQATARVTQRRADLLPTLSAAAGPSSRTFNTATLGLDLPTGPGQRPIFDPDGQVEGPVTVVDLRGRVSANLLDLAAVQRVRAARTGVAAARAEVGAQGETAAATAATSYLRVERADAQLRNRVADSTLAAELLGIARQQLAAGTGVALDVTRAQAQLAGARAALLAARNERDRARLELLRALNLPLDTPLVLADTLGGGAHLRESVPDERAAVARALERRPDLVAAARQLDAVRQQVQAIRAERLPAVQAFADQGSIGKSFAHLLPTYTWGVQLSVPIFDGFRREGRVEETRAQQSELEVRRRDLEAQAAVEVRGALLDVRSAREQVEAAGERLRLAEQEVAQARDRFRAGVAGNADVITASLSLNTARTAFADALTGFESARVALARAQGAVTELP